MLKKRTKKQRNLKSLPSTSLLCDWLLSRVQFFTSSLHSQLAVLSSLAIGFFFYPITSLALSQRVFIPGSLGASFAICWDNWSNMVAFCRKRTGIIMVKLSGSVVQRFVPTISEHETLKESPLSFIVCPVTLRSKLPPPRINWHISGHRCVQMCGTLLEPVV